MYKTMLLKSAIFIIRPIVSFLNARKNACDETSISLTINLKTYLFSNILMRIGLFAKSENTPLDLGMSGNWTKNK